MKTIWFSMVMVLVTGCAHVQAPLSVQAVPNDCANQRAIAQYLTELAQQPRQPLESRQDYETSRKSYQARVWHLRYTCNPV